MDVSVNKCMLFSQLHTFFHNSDPKMFAICGIGFKFGVLTALSEHMLIAILLKISDICK